MDPEKLQQPQGAQDHPDHGPKLIVSDVIHDCTVSGEFGETTDLFADFGGMTGAALPDGASDPEHVMACKDATIAQLQAMLESLLPLAEDLREADEARRVAERRALAGNRELRALRSQLASTSEELQLTRIKLDESNTRRVVRKHSAEDVQRMQQRIRRLERQRILREGVLSRERKRHAATRRKLGERRKVATERWNEIRRLRSARKA